jgi:hypothetical protein
VRRRDREVIEIGECTSLNDVIEWLQLLQRRLSDDADAQVQVRGDDNFGWRITVSYFRERSAEEAELEDRYASPVVGTLRPSTLYAHRATCHQ